MLEIPVLAEGAVLGRIRFSADWVRAFAPQAPTVSIHSGRSAGRLQVESYLETAYGRAFGGEIGRHYPNLLSVEDGRGRVTAAAGFRLAHQEPPYLERYLDEPLERAIARAMGASVRRDQLAEIGNLAAHGQGASLILFLTLANHLQKLGCTHAAATATRRLRRSFARVGLCTRLLGRADPGRIEEAAQWGSYYHGDPEVLAGSVGAAIPLLIEMLRRGPVLRREQLQ